MNLQENRIRTVSLKLITEQKEVLFNAYTTHKLVEDLTMSCEMRIGKRNIFYNSNLISKIDDYKLYELLLWNLRRIVLGHPYSRLPPTNLPATLVLLASDMAIGKIDTSKYQLPRYQSYEFYLDEIMKKKELFLQDLESLTSSPNLNTYGKHEGKPDDSRISGIKKKLSEIKEIEKSAMKTSEMKKKSPHHSESPSGIQPPFDSCHDTASDEIEFWGDFQLSLSLNEASIYTNLPHSIRKQGNMNSCDIQIVKAESIRKPKLANILYRYMKDITSDLERLTYMRPNRRYENAKGILKKRTISLLCAVDCSGSIYDSEREMFLYIIKKLYSLGVNSIKYFPFDSQVYQTQKVKKQMGPVHWPYGGGTSFDEVFSEFKKSRTEVSGFVILTDGESFVTKRTMVPRKKVLWVFTDESQYMKHKELKKYGQMCFLK